MAGVAVEDALELWAASLRGVRRRIRPLSCPVSRCEGMSVRPPIGSEAQHSGNNRAWPGAAAEDVGRAHLYGALRVKRSSSPLRLDRRPGRAASPRWAV